MTPETRPGDVVHPEASMPSLPVPVTQSVPPGSVAEQFSTLPGSSSLPEGFPQTRPPSQSGPADSPSATVIIPGYDLLAELGRGGMGVVYLARQRGLDRLVALKMIRADAHPGPEERSRFLKEARALANLKHPNIVGVHEVGEHNGHPFYSLEYVEGGSLDRKLRGTPLPAKGAAVLVETLARAMQAAHDAGLIHRDLKPGNVLLAPCAEGQVPGMGSTPFTPKITDFGLVRQRDEAGLTQSGAVVGTPSYMSPEQAGGHTRTLDPRTDVYALGAILYECLTGRPPFRAATVLETLDQVRRQEPVTPTALSPSCPRDLETICVKCLAKERDKRYPSARALADELRRFLEGRPILARPISAPGRLWRWYRRNPKLATALTAFVLALLLGIAGTSTAAVIALNQAEQRKIAEDNERQRADGERREKHQVQLERDRLADRDYVRGVGQASEAWLKNDAPKARVLLDELRPVSGQADRRDFEWFYLDRLCRLAELIEVPAERVALLEDGRHLIGLPSNSRGAIAVVDIATRRLVRSVTLPAGYSWDDSLINVTPSSVSRQVAAWSRPGQKWTRITLDLLSGKETGRVEVSARAVVLPCPGSPRLIVVEQAAGFRGILRCFDPSQGKDLWKLEPQAFPGSEMAVSPDGKRLAGLVDGWKVFETETGKSIPLRGPMNDLFGPRFSDDGKRLCLFGKQPDTNPPLGVIHVWDTTTGEYLKKTPLSTQVVNLGWGPMASAEVIVSPDATRATLARADQLELYDLVEGRLLNTHMSRPVAFSPDGTRLIVQKTDRSIGMMLDARTGQWIPRAQNFYYLGSQFSGRFSPDGRWFHTLTAGESGTIQVWDLHAPRNSSFTIRPGKRGGSTVACSPDGRFLITRGQKDSFPEKGVRLWPLDGGIERKELHILPVGFDRSARPQHRDYANITAASFSQDGRRLALASGQEPMRLLDPETGQDVLRFQEFPNTRPPSMFDALALSPDGKWLARLYDDGIRLWETERGQPVRHIPVEPAQKRILLFSPDSSRLATLVRGTHPHLQLWNLQGEKVLGVTPLAGGIHCAAFSSDSTLIATADSDQRIRIRDMASGTGIRDLTGLQTTVTALAFARQGEVLLVGGADHLVTAWNVKDGTRIATLGGVSTGHTAPLVKIVPVGDGRRVATMDRLGTVILWDAATWQEVLLLPYQTALGIDPTGAEFDLAIAPDRRRLFAILQHPILHIWDARETRP